MLVMRNIFICMVKAKSKTHGATLKLGFGGLMIIKSVYVHYRGLDLKVFIGLGWFNSSSWGAYNHCIADVFIM
jgi:hypothetical protein